MDKPQLIEHLNASLNYTIYDCKWIPCSAKFIVLGSKPNYTGIVDIYELNENELTKVNSIEKRTAFKCATFGASPLHLRHLALGDFEGRLQVL